VKDCCLETRLAILEMIHDRWIAARQRAEQHEGPDGDTIWYENEMSIVRELEAVAKAIGDLLKSDSK